MPATSTTFEDYRLRCIARCTGSAMIHRINKQLHIVLNAPDPAMVEQAKQAIDKELRK